MNVYSKLTQQKLQEILLTIYIKGEEAENIKVRDLIKEIKQQILLSAYVVKEKEHSFDKSL